MGKMRSTKDKRNADLTPVTALLCNRNTVNLIGVPRATRA